MDEMKKARHTDLLNALEAVKKERAQKEWYDRVAATLAEMDLRMCHVNTKQGRKQYELRDTQHNTILNGHFSLEEIAGVLNILEHVG